MTRILVFILAYLSTMYCFAGTKQYNLASNLFCSDTETANKCNPGFENGLSGVFVGGTPTTEAITTTAVNVSSGKNAFEYDADAANGHVNLGTYDVEQGMLSKNGVACIDYKGGGGDYDMLINTTGVSTLATIAMPDSTAWTTLCVNFIFPSANDVWISIDANAAATDPIYLDNYLVADANKFNISQISQARFVGGAYWQITTSCTWGLSSGSWSDFPLDADCDNNPITYKGLAIADASNPGQLPQIRISETGAGHYVVVAQTAFGTGTTGQYYTNQLRFNDGTNAANNFSYSYFSEADNYSHVYRPNGMIRGTFDYETGGGEKTFKLQGDFVDEILYIYGSIAGLSIEVYYYPSTSQTAYSASTQMVASGVKIASNASHADSTTSATYEKMTDTDIITADRDEFGTATETATAGDFGFKMPTVKTGGYFVYANVHMQNTYTTDTTICVWSIYDGTTTIAESKSNQSGERDNISSIFGYVNYDSVQTDLEFTIYAKRVSGGGTCYTTAVDAQAEIGIIPIGESVNKPQIIDTQWKRYDLTVTGTGLTTTYAYGWPYVDIDGNWKLKYLIHADYTTSATTKQATISGVTFSETQASWARGKSADYTTATPTTGTGLIQLWTGTAVSTWDMGGDAMLTEKPTWATGIYH